MNEDLANFIILAVISTYLHWPFVLLFTWAAFASILLHTLRQTNQRAQIGKWGFGLVLLTTATSSQKEGSFAYSLSWSILLLFTARIFYALWQALEIDDDDGGNGGWDDYSPEISPTPTPSSSRPICHR